MTEKDVREWLLWYAWMGTPDRQRREVNCIMSQDGWRHLEARKEQLRGQASGDETNLEEQVDGYALSGLYECHDGPHIATCPHKRD